MSQFDTDMTRHYAFNDAEAAVSSALDQLTKAGVEVSLKELAALDQFHTGGMDATRTMAQKAGLKADDRVLDVGGGLGGPARMLAKDFDCDVTVLELMAAYCRIGEMLNERTQLTPHVHFKQGNALDMPFADKTFDAVWTQHSSMNIGDKATLYQQIFRVLRSGGTLVMHEIVAGSVQPIHFPVMWSREAATSFLTPPEELKTLLMQTGFEVKTWDDTSAESIAWFEKRAAAQQNANPNRNPLGVQLLLGPDFGVMVGHFLQNLREDRARVLQVVLRRP